VDSPPDWTFPKPNNQNAPLRVSALASYTALSSPFRRATSEEPLLTATAVGSERVWFATDALVSPPSARGLRELVARSRDAGAAILVVHPPAVIAGGARPDGSSASADPSPGGAASRPLRRVVTPQHRFTTSEADFSVTAPVLGWVFLADRWAAGWKAWVDGKESPVWGGRTSSSAPTVWRKGLTASGPPTDPPGTRTSSS